MSSEQLARGQSTRTDRHGQSGGVRSTTPAEEASTGRQRDPEPDGSDALVELLGDEYTLDILRTLSAEPLSAAALVDRLEMSRATVYRRLDRLQEHGLVAADTAVSANGNQYEVFEAALRRLTVDLSDGVPRVSVGFGDEADADPDADDRVSQTATASAD